MIDKKLILTIHRKDTCSLYGVLTTDIINRVCEQTGLSQQQFLDSLAKLRHMGIVDTEVAVMH